MKRHILTNCKLLFLKLEWLCWRFKRFSGMDRHKKKRTAETQRTRRIAQRKQFFFPLQLLLLYTQTWKELFLFIWPIP